MLKGVNKRIIEVLDTQSEYFEKVILFVNSDSTLDGMQILKHANDYVKNMEGQAKGAPIPRKNKRATLASVLKIGSALTAGAGIATFFQFIFK